MAKHAIEIFEISDDDSDNGNGSGRPSKKGKVSAEVQQQIPAIKQRGNDYGCSSGSKQQGPTSSKARQTIITTPSDSMMTRDTSMYHGPTVSTGPPKASKRGPSIAQIIQKDLYDIALLKDHKKKMSILQRALDKDIRRRNADTSRSRVDPDELFAEQDDPALYAVKALSTRQYKNALVAEIEKGSSDMTYTIKALERDEDPVCKIEDGGKDQGDLERHPTINTDRRDAQVTSIKDPLCFVPKQEPIFGDDEELFGIQHHPIKLEQQDEQTVLHGDQALGQNYETNQAIIPMFASQHNNETTNEVKDNDDDRDLDRLLREALEQQSFTPHSTSTPLQMPPITDTNLRVDLAHDVYQGPEVEEDDRASTAGQWVA